MRYIGPGWLAAYAVSGCPWIAIFEVSPLPLIADEDWLGTEDGDCEPRSVLDPENAASAAVIIPKGTPQLLVDP